jgi:hypothetical protein
VVNGIAAVISVLAGSLASFFTGSIRASLALPKDPSNGSTFATSNFELTGEAIAFWLLILLAACLFAWSKYSDSATDNEHKGFVSKALQGLESMPPSAFLQQLADEYRSAHEEVIRLQASFMPYRGNVTEEAIDEAIRKVLTAVAKVVQAYDGHVHRDYRLSLLLFSRNGWDKEKLQRAVDVDTLTQGAQIGSIESSSSLSIVYKVEKDNPSFPNNREFAFPVHKERSKDDRINVLPGPPRAFISKGMYECNSVEKLLADDVEFADRNHLNKIREFFTTGPGSGTKSFVSLAVPNNQWNSTVSMAGSDVAAIVHIEANDINVVKSASGFFWPVAQPFLLMISDLLALRSIVMSTISSDRSN